MDKAHGCLENETQYFLFILGFVYLWYLSQCSMGSICMTCPKHWTWQVTALVIAILCQMCRYCMYCIELSIHDKQGSPLSIFLTMYVSVWGPGYRFVFVYSYDTAAEKQTQGLRLAFLAASLLTDCMPMECLFVHVYICICLFAINPSS